jgi:hypothetical protein
MDSDMEEKAQWGKITGRGFENAYRVRVSGSRVDIEGFMVPGSLFTLTLSGNKSFLIKRVSGNTFEVIKAAA